MRKIKHILAQKDKLVGEYSALMNCADKSTLKTWREAIEVVLNPIWLLITNGGAFKTDDVEITPCIEKFAQALDPTYEKLIAEVAKEGGRSSAAVEVYCIERYAWFAAGHLMGMAQSGRSMKEIREMGISMVARGC